METKPAPGRDRASGPPLDPLAPLVSRIAEGDEQALRDLYDALAPRVLGLSRQILRDIPAAEEAVVDVFAQVWRQATRYEVVKGTVATWVCTLARTRAIDVRRQRARHTSRETAIDGIDVEFGADPGSSPFTLAAAGDRAERVQLALSLLPQDQRRAVEAAFFGGLSHTEIAAAFGQPLGTVKTRIRSGLVALRTALATVEDEVA
ncbi:MAG: sigma-70 family RNA polymerase sigma factor [Planctomycetes bacterium]|nr:sigma-70 family RNA polymerase sigma factor [Planctomycetota bacterium]